jgi:signal transduction histidine kinase
MNIRIYLLYLCLSLGYFKAIPQSLNRFAQIDKKISARTDDTTKVLLYIELIDTLSRRNELNNGFIIAQKALALSRKLHYTHGVIISLARYGGIFEVIKRDYPAAIVYYKQAIKIAELYGSSDDVNTSYSIILNMYYYLGDYPGAMVIAQKGLAYTELRSDTTGVAHYNNQLGFIYLKQEKAAEAMKYYQQYLNLAAQLARPMLIADAYTDMADVYLLKKDYQTTLSYLFKALGLYKRNNIEIIKKKNLGSKADRFAYVLYKISNAYKLQGKYQLSLQYALKGLNYHIDTRPPSYNQYDLASYYINTGEIYMALKHYSSAMQFLNRGLSLSINIRHHEDMLDAYNGLSKAYALQSRYDSAYYYQGKHAKLKDSILNEKTSRAVEQTRNSFESDKKDKEIVLLKQQQKLKETESENRNLLLNIVIVFFSLLAVISYLIIYIRNNHKQQRLDNEKQLAVQTERHRISGDMHDDIGTGLSTMLLYINMLKSKLSGHLEYPDVEKVALLGNELVAQMKEIVWSLNPVNDSLESLLIFIRQYFAQLFDSLPYKTNIIFPTSIPDIALKGVIRRNVYLCIKEAINNVIKHADANRVELNIQLHHNKLTISIKDNGEGFPDHSDGKFFSNGLKNMQHRMEQVNGKFKFYNDDGAFVYIELELRGYPNG